MEKIVKKISDVWNATILCVKYPFLYPRNRWTGKHYNNWKLLEKMKQFYNKAYNPGNKDTGYYPTVKNIWYVILWKTLRFWHDYPLQWMHCLTNHTEWDALEKGWKIAFGDQLLKDLKKAMLNDGGLKYLYGVRIMQIKEKRGMLEIYLDRYGKETEKVINRYRSLSWKTCIFCGKEAVGYSTGWVFTLLSDMF